MDFICADIIIYGRIFADPSANLWCDGEPGVAIPAAELATMFLSMWLHQKYFWKPGEQNYITE